MSMRCGQQAYTIAFNAPVSPERTKMINIDSARSCLGLFVGRTPVAHVTVWFNGYCVTVLTWSGSSMDNFYCIVKTNLEITDLRMSTR